MLSVKPYKMGAQCTHMKCACYIYMIIMTLYDGYDDKTPVLSFQPIKCALCIYFCFYFIFISARE